MPDPVRFPWTRRRLIRAGLVALLPASLLSCASGPSSRSPASPSRRRAATPACEHDEHEATPPAIEGPFFLPRSPERVSLLESGIEGEQMFLSGLVVSTEGVPVAGALIDFWQADAEGEYDVAGYRLRGHQFSDAGGRYRLETVVPGNYEGRTRHLHVKVQAPHRKVLTTQLFFPDDPLNEGDWIFDPELAMQVERSAGRRDASFEFVLDLG